MSKVDKSTLKCNKPRRTPGHKTKSHIVKACEGGKEKIIHFGAKGYGHNYSKAARKSFRARHGCDKKKSKLTASYWACRDLWSAGGKKKTTGTKGGVAKRRRK